jgi:hypothetical protein
MSEAANQGICRAPCWAGLVLCPLPTGCVPTKFLDPEESSAAGWRTAQLCGQQAFTLKKLGAAIGVACSDTKKNP